MLLFINELYVYVHCCCHSFVRFDIRACVRSLVRSFADSLVRSVGRSFVYCVWICLLVSWCLCTCVFTCDGMCIHLHVCECIYSFDSMFVCLRVSLSNHLFVLLLFDWSNWIDMSVYVHVFACVWLCVCFLFFVCAHVHLVMFMC